MPFLNPTVFFTGLGLASAPIIIHLLNRRRYRIRDWAAMQFLLESLRKNRKRLRIEELILLLLRTLVVVALAFALGRFLGCGDTLGSLAGRESRTVVFVLDDSYSMGQNYADKDLFKLAREDLIERMEELPETDRVAILLTSRPEEPWFEPAIMTDRESVYSDLRGLELSDRRTALAPAVEQAQRILQKESGQRHLYLLSDLRRVDLADKDRSERLGKLLEQMRGQRVSLRVLDYGLDPRRNLTVESIELLERFVAAGQDAEFEITVRNNSPISIGDAKVQLEQLRYVDGKLDSTKVQALNVTEQGPIAPGQSRSVLHKHSFSQAGPAVLRASVAADELEGDNQAGVALNVQPVVRVCVVDGRASIRPRNRESYYLTWAIDPRDKQMFGMRPTVYNPDEISLIDFDRYDLVMLLNVPEMPRQINEQGQSVYPKLRELERYVANGGGLAIFTGPRLNMRFYNNAMYADGAGLMPFKIKAPLQAREFFRMQPADLISHPLFAGIEAAHKASGLSFTDLIRFYAITPADEGAGRTAANPVKPEVLTRFTDDGKHPAIVETQFGQGKVITLFSTASDLWNDWAKAENGLYVLTMHELIPYLAKARKLQYTAMVTEPIVHELPDSLAQAEATLTLHPSADLGRREPRRRCVVTANRAIAWAQQQPQPGPQDVIDAAQRLLQTAEQIGKFESVSDQQMQLYGAATSLLEALESSEASVPPSLLTGLRGRDEDLRQFILRWERTPASGVYSLHLEESPEKIAQSNQIPVYLYVRNVDPAEGQLTPADTERIESVLGQLAYYDARAGKESGKSIAAVADEEDWWMIALISVVVLMAAETFLGQKFGHYSSNDISSQIRS